MKIKIANVSAENKYKGAYAKIFRILNVDRLFSEIYETEDSTGLVDTDYYLTISEFPDSDKVEKIQGIKNVTII